MYRYILRESCSQFDSLPQTSLTISQFLRRELRRQRYDEVRTPLLFDRRLWEISGHWDHYKENMYSVVGGTGDGDGGECEESGGGFSLKPMSCPAHCLVFDAVPRTARELPLRLADFSALHRNEATGALHGLTRVRRFAQDDGHIFCADDEDQLRSEVAGCLELIERTYGVLGFEYVLARCCPRALAGLHPGRPPLSCCFRFDLYRFCTLSFADAHVLSLSSAPSRGRPSSRAPPPPSSLSQLLHALLHQAGLVARRRCGMGPSGRRVERRPG